MFDNDVTEFADRNCMPISDRSEASVGEWSDIEVEGAARSRLIECSYSAWSVAGPNFVSVHPWLEDLQIAPQLDQSTTLVGKVHAALAE